MTTGPLDPSKDPDRFDPGAEPEALGPLDPALDPDRFDPKASRRSQTLPEMLGEGAFEDERNNLDWLVGLLGIVLFLAIVTAVIYI
jgi:hypothetical protein